MTIAERMTKSEQKTMLASQFAIGILGALIRHSCFGIVLIYSARALVWSRPAIDLGVNLSFLDRADCSRAFSSRCAVSLGAVARRTKLRGFASTRGSQDSGASRFCFSRNLSKHIAVADAD